MAHTVWTITALHTPRVMRRCSRCDRRRAFVSSDRFRVNAHKQRLDVWLIYNCIDCAQSWNFTVHERLGPAAIGREELERFHANDRDASWGVAFDSERFKRLGIEADFNTAYRVTRAAAGVGAVRMQLVHPCRVRLDRLLAGELCVPRRSVSEYAAGVTQRDLRKPVRDGQELILT